MADCTHVNIMVVGKSGAGKSTLVNTLMNLRPQDPQYCKPGLGPGTGTKESKTVKCELDDDSMDTTTYHVVGCLECSSMWSGE